MSPKTIKLISWNINGMSNKVKCYKIISHLKSLACNMAMLQKVHLKKAEISKLKPRQVRQVFSAPGSRATRGVSILIAKRISLKLIKQISDKDREIYCSFNLLTKAQTYPLVNICTLQYGL